MALATFVTIVTIAALAHTTTAACDPSRIMAWKWSSVTGAYSIMIAQAPSDCPCNADPTPLFQNPADPTSPTRPNAANPGPWPSNLARVCTSMGASITTGVVTNAGWCSVRFVTCRRRQHLCAGLYVQHAHGSRLYRLHRLQNLWWYVARINKTHSNTFCPHRPAQHRL